MLFGQRSELKHQFVRSAVALVLPILDFALLHLNTETKVATPFAYGSLLGEPSGCRAVYER
jgi:hypothetical protein